MKGVKEASERDFKAEVLNSSIPVLVDFYAPWCGPCRLLGPVLEGIARFYDGKLAVVKVNVDESQELAAQYGVQAVPTMVFFRNGQTVDTIVGLPSAGVMRQKLEAVAGTVEPVAAAG